jgi:CarD family transcriptional regulator
MTKIKTGSLVEIADVLRQLFLLKHKKTLSFGEKKMLDQCKGLIAQEISISMGNEIKQVESKIDSCFQ